MGWLVSTRIYSLVVLGAILAILIIDLLMFTVLSVRLAFFVPTIALLGSSAIAFNTRLRDEQRRKLSIELEQKTAAILQKDFLPAPRLSNDTFELVCHYQAAVAIGGDWYSYYLIDNRWLFFHVADVTGHGAPSALCASYAKGSIDAIHRALESFSSEEPPLYQVHQQLNNILSREGSERFLITLVSIAIDLQDGKLWHFNSGHPPGLVVNSTFEKVSQLCAIGTPILGFGPDFALFKPKSIDLKTGDYIVLYTDGLSSAVKKLVRNVVHPRTRAEKTTLPSGSPQGLLEHVLHLHQEKSAKGPVEHDDITLVVLRFKGTTPKPLTTLGVSALGSA
jgi:sigma-B regulation protein RsbU (phosphoserine phosphatase)